MTKATSWVAAVVVAVPLALAGLWLGTNPGTGTAADDDMKAWKQVGDKADLEKLVKLAGDQLKTDLTALAGGKLDQKAAGVAKKRATYLALLVAAYGQSDPKDFGGARDLGLKIHEAAKAGKFDEAAADAAKLTSAKDSASAGPVDLVKAADKEEARDGVMSLFKLRARGGVGLNPKPVAAQDGIESRLNSYQNKIPSGAVNDDLRLLAVQVAVLAELTGHVGPDKAEGKKTPAKWKEFSGQMLDASEKFVKAAKAKKDKDIKAAITAVNNSCTSCHEIFRAD